MENLSPEMTPADIISRLASDAKSSGSLEPMSRALQMMQRQLDAAFNKMAEGTGQIGMAIAQTRMHLDLLHLTVGIIIRIMTEKDLVSREAFEERYKREAIDIIEKRVKAQEEANKPREEQIQEPEVPTESTETA